MSSEPSVTKFAVKCSQRDLVRLSAKAVDRVLGKAKNKYKYNCISILDSMALNAMRAMERHGNEELYLNTGIQAIRDYLQDRPDFLQYETRMHTNHLERPKLRNR